MRFDGLRCSASATLEFGGTRVPDARQVRPLNLTAGGIGDDVLDMHSLANPPQPEKKIERFENTSELLSKNMIGTSETFATDLDIGDIGITFTRSPRGGDPVDISRTILGLLGSWTLKVYSKAIRHSESLFKQH